MIQEGFDPRMIEGEELSKSDWEPPEGLTIKALQDFDRPFIPLDTVLNLLAYGVPNFEINYDDGNWPAVVARTMRAWNHLRVAAENGTVELIGGGIVGESIDANNLRKTTYVLVTGKDNAIEPDLERYSDDDFFKLFNGGARPQIHYVRVDKASLVKWLGEQLTTWEKSKALPMSDDDLCQWIRAKEAGLGNRPPIRTWENCPELSARRVTKARFEAIWRELYPSPEKGRRSKERTP